MDQSQLPPEARESLRGSFSGLSLPARVDAAVLSAAAGKAASIRRRRWMVRAGPLAAAAALAMGWFLWPSFRGAGPAQNVAFQPPRDIVDVLRAAVEIRDGRALDPRLDIDADGSVTTRDLDRFAGEIVSLNRVPAAAGGRS